MEKEEISADFDLQVEFDLMPAQDSGASATKLLFTVGSIERNTASLISDNFDAIQVPLSVIGNEISIGDCIRIEFTRDFSHERVRAHEFESLIGQLIEQYTKSPDTDQTTTKFDVAVLKVAHNFVLLDFSDESITPTDIIVDGKCFEWIKAGPKHVKILNLLPNTFYEFEIRVPHYANHKFRIQTPKEQDLSSILLFVTDNGEEIQQAVDEIGIQLTSECNEYVTHALDCGDPETIQKLLNLHIPVKSLKWLKELKSSLE